MGMNIKLESAEMESKQNTQEDANVSQKFARERWAMSTHMQGLEFVLQYSTCHIY